MMWRVELIFTRNPYICIIYDGRVHKWLIYVMITRVFNVGCVESEKVLRQQQLKNTF